MKRSSKRILIIEPFFSGSHASWARGFQSASLCEVDLLTLPGRHWKWRMHGAAVTLARQFREAGKRYDLIIATDMLDLSVFLSLTRDILQDTAVAVYFHENQLSYPWSPQDRDVRNGRDFHYGFINWTTVLSADAVWFNSEYNRSSFFDSVRRMLKAMPDRRETPMIQLAEDKSRVLPLGIRLQDLYCPVEDKDLSRPVILWNHRWEYDKDPRAFFGMLERLQAREIDFGLIVCGASKERHPKVFNTVPEQFSKELMHFGFADDRPAYRHLLERANILPVTNRQEFFGQSVVEAISAGCLPLLPDALAYPEHIPEALHNDLLYGSLEDLESKLVSACLDLSGTMSSVKAVQENVMGYDWEAVAPLYDALIHMTAKAGSGTSV